MNLSFNTQTVNPLLILARLPMADIWPFITQAVKGLSGWVLATSPKKDSLQVRAKDQKGSIQLGTNKYGGAMVIFNKGSQDVLQASVGDMGGGIITTRDKHGYRTGRLP